MNDNSKLPTPVLKCTKVTITDKCTMLAFAQRIGASSKLPQEFTIAIGNDDMKKIVNNCIDSDADSASMLENIIRLRGNI